MCISILIIHVYIYMYICITCLIYIYISCNPMYIYIYIHLCVYIYIYMNRGSYLVQNAIDGVFLPRSPVPSLFLGSAFNSEMLCLPTSFSGSSYLVFQPNYDVFDKPGYATKLFSIQPNKSRRSYIHLSRDSIN